MNLVSPSRHAALAAAFCVLLPSLLAAQTTTGTIAGRIVDGSGRPIAGVTVKARHSATDTSYTAKSDEQGQYEFTVPSGTYDVTTVESPAFGAALRTVSVAMGSATRADFDPSTPPAHAVDRARRSREIEVSGRLGWTLSDGVSAGRNLEASDGNLYNRVDAVDSLSWGLTFGVFLTQHLEVEFIFDRQASTLQVEGTKQTDIGDLGIGNYHGVVSYHFGAKNRPFRIYAFGGAGVTSYGSVTFTPASGDSRTIDGGTKLSGTMGGGVKFYGGRDVGARIEARFTPTYIKSTDDGWWCDEYWGCYSLEQLHYAKQFEISGGVTVRF
jgi:hypothetical protein